MKAKIAILLFAMLLFSVCSVSLFAATTGKISGRITDAETGEPLIAANVIIKGTLMGAASDVNGHFAIINVPPGDYTVETLMVGYQTLQFDNVRVRIDLTTEINAAMHFTTLNLGETVVVTAERSLVLKDMTSSLSTTSAEQIESLPVQSITEVLRLNAGIVESDGRLHIRGGRPGEVAYWVDGISVTDVYDGRIGVTVENTAVQELQVISGTFNAEYGQAMSGIVNIVTKEGGQDYKGQVKVYGGDYVSNSDKFSIYKKVTTERDPQTGLTRVVSSERDYPLKKLNPIYNGEFSLSGPMPLIGNKVNFFTTGRYFSDEGYFYGREWFKPNGLAGDSSLVALNPNTRLSWQGKLNFQLSSSFKLTYNLFWNKTDRDRNYFRFNSADYQFNPEGQANFSQFNSHNYRYVPNGLPEAHSEGITHTLTLNHVLSPSTFYELRVSRYTSESNQYKYKDPTTGVHYLVQVTADPVLGLVAETFDPSTEAGQAHLQEIITLGGVYQYVPDPTDPDGYIDTDAIQAPASASFMNKGMDITHVERTTSYWVGKIDFTSQFDAVNQLKFGSEVRLHELDLLAYQIVPETDANGQELTPFRPAVPELGSIYRNEYNRKPQELSAYLQDKVEFKHININIGLRWDYFDAQAKVPTDPTDPNIYAPFKNEHIYANWVDMPATYEGTEEQYIREKLTSGDFRELTLDERRAMMLQDIDAKMSVSPRLGIAFPITDRGVIHFSYGHFFQIPEFQYLYTNPDYKLTSGSGTAVFGNPDLKPQKTVMYEIGLQQQISDDIGIDFTLFYRDVRDWVGTSPSIATEKTSVYYSKYENKDYSNVRGITFKLEKRFSDNYSYRADYSYQVAEGTYSNPADAYNSALANQSPVLALVPMNWDQRHTLNAQVIYEISEWTFSLIGRYWSGRPYTPSFPVSEQVGASAVSGLTNNSARRPAQKNIDLTINRVFKMSSRLNMEFFINIYNLLDQRDDTNVYGDTGTAEYTTNTDPSRTPYNAARVSTVEDFVLQESWYSAPRQVHVGVILGF
jgi:hypothetical protein